MNQEKESVAEKLKKTRRMLKSITVVSLSILLFLIVLIIVSVIASDNIPQQNTPDAQPQPETKVAAVPTLPKPTPEVQSNNQQSSVAPTKTVTTNPTSIEASPATP